MVDVKKKNIVHYTSKKPTKHLPSPNYREYFVPYSLTNIYIPQTIPKTYNKIIKKTKIQDYTHKKKVINTLCQHVHNLSFILFHVFFIRSIILRFFT